MKLQIKFMNQSKASYLKLTTLPLVLMALSGCGGGNSGSNLTTQNSVLSEFEQRRAIVLQQIQNEESVVIPDALKTDSELSASDSGAYGTRLGKPAISGLGYPMLLASEPCINIGKLFEPRNFSIGDGDDDHVEITRTDSTDAASQSSAIAANLSVGYGLLSTDASAEIKNESLFRRNAIGFTLEEGVKGTHSLLDIDTSSKKKFFQSKYVSWLGDLNTDFFKFCGDSFVRQERYVAEIKGSISIVFEDSSSKDSFNSLLDGSYSTLVKVSNAISKAESATHTKGNVILKIQQIGGIKAELFKAVSEDIVQCRLDNFEACNKQMESLVTYAKTLSSQINDENTGALKPDKVKYVSPTLVRYDDLISTKASGTSAKGRDAIDHLNDYYAETIRLYYALKDVDDRLKGSTKDTFDKDIFKKVSNRLDYIAGMAPKCYQDPDQCADTYLATIFSDTSKTFPLDVNKFQFYTKFYNATNFLNLHGRFGDAVDHIIFVPSLIYKDKSGNVKYEYTNQRIPGCDSSLVCDPGNFTVVVSPKSTGKYTLDVKEMSSIQYDCTEGEGSKKLSCDGFNYSGSSATPVRGNYTWKDTIDYEYAGGLDVEEIEQYLNPVYKYGATSVK